MTLKQQAEEIIKDILDPYPGLCYRERKCIAQALSSSLLQAVRGVVPEKKYLIDNLPKETHEYYLEEAQKARDTVEGFNSAITEMERKINED